MDIRQLSPTYFVGPQIEPAMMDALKAQGITRILCNRPDAEVPAPLGAAAMRTAAEDAGLEFAVQPLTHQTMTEEVIAHNRDIGADKDGVTFAYCASGTRSCIAWALGQAGKMKADDIIKAGREAGYDLEPMRDHLTKAEG
ncbi:TIGR01244 family sulfur transferase [Sulfitobacter sp. HNIBRBA3233]|uniref:TIGR01244 family sulfur transferase n=1 Tax=Sulfitobacter marinivivus TaxID=3158558 RepID=UPI0032DFE5FA